MTTNYSLRDDNNDEFFALALTNKRVNICGIGRNVGENNKKKIEDNPKDPLHLYMSNTRSTIKAVNVDLL